MKTEGRHPEEGAHPDDNVVRFPGEWIGSRDELVPMGQNGTSSSIELDPPPPAPDDFWGEGSAAIQSALMGPSAADDVRSTSDAPAPRPRVSRLRPALVTLALPRRALATTGAVIAAVVIVLVVVLAGLASRPPRTPVQRAGIAKAPSLTPSPSPLRRHDAKAPGGRKTVRRSSVKRATLARHSTIRRRVTRKHRHAASVATPVRYVAEPATVTSNTSSGSSTPPSSVLSSVNAESHATSVGTPAGPTSLGGAVGNNCNPKCS